MKKHQLSVVVSGAMRRINERLLDSPSFMSNVATLRKKFLECMTEDELVAITQAMIGAAKGGDVHAANFLFERVFGKTVKEIVQHRVATNDDSEHEDFVNHLKLRYAGKVVEQLPGQNGNAKESA